MTDGIIARIDPIKQLQTLLKTEIERLGRLGLSNLALAEIAHVLAQELQAASPEEIPDGFALSLIVAGVEERVRGDPRLQNWAQQKFVSGIEMLAF